MIVTGGITDLTKPALHKVFIETGKERADEYPLMVNHIMMPTNPLTDFQVSGLGASLSKPEGEVFPLDDFYLGGSKTYTAESYGLAIEVTIEAWQDELYGVVRDMVREIRRSCRYTVELEGAHVFNRAFNAAYTGFDGKPLCATDHPSIDGSTTFSNTPAVATAFSKTAIQDALLSFEGMQNERGLPMLMQPSRLYITPADRFVASEILGSAQVPYSANNEINVLVEEDLMYMVCHYLTSGYWFLGTKPSETDLKYYYITMPTFDMFDDPWTRNGIATGWHRQAPSSFGSWRGIYGSYSA